MILIWPAISIVLPRALITSITSYALAYLHYAASVYVASVQKELSQ